MWLRFGNHNSILVTSLDNIAWLNLWLLIFWHEKLQVFVWCDEPHFCGCVFSVDFYFISVIALYCISEKPRISWSSNHTQSVWIVFIPISCWIHFYFPCFPGVFILLFWKFIYYISFVSLFIKILPIIFHFCWTGWRSPEISAIKVILLSFIYSN